MIGIKVMHIHVEKERTNEAKTPLLRDDKS